MKKSTPGDVDAADFEILRKQVDALQATAAEKAPWYKQLSTIISISALALTMLSTAWSIVRENQGDNRALREEARGLLLQVIELHKFVQTKDGGFFVEDPKISVLLSAVRDLERQVHGQLSYDEYFEIGNLTTDHANPPDAIAYYQEALEKAQSDTDKAAVYKKIGANYYVISNYRNFELAHINLRKAIAVYLQRRNPGEAYLLSGALLDDAEAYHDEGRPADMKRVLGEVLRNFDQIKDKDWQDQAKSDVVSLLPDLGMKPDFDLLRTQILPNGK